MPEFVALASCKKRTPLHWTNWTSERWEDAGESERRSCSLSVTVVSPPQCLRVHLETSLAAREPRERHESQLVESRANLSHLLAHALTRILSVARQTNWEVDAAPHPP